MRGPAIAALISQGAIQPTLFDNQDMAEITSPDYPGERLIACYNPFLEAERARKRGEHSFATLLADPAAITAHRIQPSGGPPAFTMITTPTPIQRRAYELLGVSHRHGYV